MKLTEGSSINGFRILTENDLTNNFYITPKKKEGGGNYASLMSIDLSKLYNIGYGKGVINFNVKGSSFENKFVNCDVILKINLENNILTHSMTVSNNSIYSLKDKIIGRVSGKNIIIYCILDEIADFLVCEYKSLHFYSDNMIYGDLTDIKKPTSLSLNNAPIGGDNISPIINNMKHKDCYRLTTNKEMTGEIILTSDSFSSFLNANNKLLNVIKQNGVYEIEFISSFSNVVTDPNAYVVVQINSVTKFVNRFIINSSNIQSSSIITKFITQLNKNDVITIKVVTSQTKGLTLNTNTYLKVTEM